MVPIEEMCVTWIRLCFDNVCFVGVSGLKKTQQQNNRMLAPVKLRSAAQGPRLEKPQFALCGPCWTKL